MSTELGPELGIFSKESLVYIARKFSYEFAGMSDEKIISVLIEKYDVIKTTDGLYVVGGNNA